MDKKNNIEIDLNKKESCYIIRGRIENILKNKRLLFSFKRLKYKEINGEILIPFEKNHPIERLEEIEEILDKFGIIENISSRTKKEVDNYCREQKYFQEFSLNAEKIRNNEFKDNPSLVSDFNDFQSIVKKHLTRSLYPLQLLSAYHMAFSQNSCNFSVPGAGKTTIVYAAYAYLKNLPKDNPKHVDKLIVIGPLSSFAPWEKEFQQCFSRKTGIKRLSGDSSIKKSEKIQHLYSGKPSEITLLYHGGVNGLQTELIDFLKKNKTMVVVDEAHRIKNPEGIWGKSIIRIAKEATSRIILTGTPVPNGYEDLYNLYQFIYPFKFKDILKFHYPNLQDMTKASNLDSERVKGFTDNILPYFTRIKKIDLKLPPIKENLLYVEMGKNQREIYDFIETKYVKSFQNSDSDTLKDILNRARLIRLRQAAINPSLLIKPIEETLEKEDFQNMVSLGKMIPEEFQSNSEIISKINNYSKIEIPQKFICIYNLIKEKIIGGEEKLLVWMIFTQNAKEFRKFLSKKGVKSKLLIGEIEQKEREKIIEKFNNPKNLEFQVVIANPFAVAESISLHKGCHNAVYMERDYNCSNFLQSKDRIHRVGLLDNQLTNYYYVLSKDSIDNVINRQLNIKIKRMEKIINHDIPLFSRIDNPDKTDLIKALLDDYARRT